MKSKPEHSTRTLSMALILFGLLTAPTAWAEQAPTPFQSKVAAILTLLFSRGPVTKVVLGGVSYISADGLVTFGGGTYEKNAGNQFYLVTGTGNIVPILPGTIAGDEISFGAGAFTAFSAASSVPLYLGYYGLSFNSVTSSLKFSTSLLAPSGAFLYCDNIKLDACRFAGKFPLPAAN